MLEENYQVLEFWYPFYRLREAGFPIFVIAPEVQVYKSEEGYTAKSDLKITDIDPEKFDLLIIPGGKAPKKLRQNENALNLVKQFNQMNKTIATICHGAELLIAANIVTGTKISCPANIAEELKKAGGIFVDEAVTMDGNFITSRQPDDLPKFMEAILSKLKVK
jgi:protease I